MSQGVRQIQEQLLGAFFDEAFEALDQIEGCLLQLERGDGQPSELVNDIFRAAHSIKGGAATFGVGAVADFAHVMENLLDIIRAGRTVPDASIVALLLESVDGLRSLTLEARDGTPADNERVKALRDRLERSTPKSDQLAHAPKAETPPRRRTRFAISFAPRPHLLETGNDPILLLRELALLGELSVSVDIGSLPPLRELDPHRCYLRWTATLDGEVSRRQIEDVFAWVEDDAELAIVDAAADQPPASAANPADVKAAPSRKGADAPPSSDRDASATSIRVAVEKIDLLMNMVGELVITQSMLGQLDDDGPIDLHRLARLREGLSLLARNTRLLQESVMSLRSMPIGVVFGRLPRLVHDLGRQLGKQVELRLAGQTTELDKTVLEKLGDPLVHLVRNSLDHGVEPPDERARSGKPATATLDVRAFHQGGDIMVEVADDGRGLNLEKILARARERGLVSPDETPSEEALRELIFAPGFSTSESVSDVSGRGVGMDVVRRNVKSLGGAIQVASQPGQGTRISLRLPLTLAIIDGQLINVNGSTFVVPLLSILESVEIDEKRIARRRGDYPLYRLRNDLVPMVDLQRIFGMPSGASAAKCTLMVVVESEGEHLGILVHELLAQQQVVIKSLEANYDRVEGLAGATILGDGQVAFILDVGGLGRLVKHRTGAIGAPRAERNQAFAPE